jgi:CubicO group peptidase (beta-lactamase class C family)
MLRISGLLSAATGLCLVAAIVQCHAAANTSHETSAAAAAPLTPVDLEAWLDGAMPIALQRGDLAGAVVAVVKDGEVLLTKGYGYSDVAAKKPMDAQRTLIRPGSTSKLFTWTAVMQLYEQGKLDLDRDINAYLDFRIHNPFDTPITLKHLLTHRGGFEEGIKSILMTDVARFMTLEQYLKTHQRPIIHRPGEVPAYSNYGTALAGYIVQRVSGEPFERYIERHIFEPLQMQRSTFRQPLPASLQADMSHGYVRASEPPRPFELLTTGPAGSLSTTAADMASFMIAHLQEGRLREGNILQAQTARLMHSTLSPQVADFGTMAYGFFERRHNGRHIVGHDGDTVVFHTDMNLLLDEGVGYFLSFNSRGADDSNYDTREAIFKAFMDRYFPDRPVESAAGEEPTAARDAQRIAGRYWSSRRVESDFMSVFYVLQQVDITDNGDGTIGVPTFPTNEAKPYRETGPQVWREVNGPHAIALVERDGRKVVALSEDPSSILQPVPAWRSGRWNTPLLIFAVAVLLWAAIAWPVTAIRSRFRGAAVSTGGDSRWYRFTRVGAVVALVYLCGWAAVLAPILSNQLEVYDATLDSTLRLLQAATLLVIAGACVGLWNAWRAVRTPQSWSRRFREGLVAVALLAVVWASFVFKFASVDVNY